MNIKINYSFLIIIYLIILIIFSYSNLKAKESDYFEKGKVFLKKAILKNQKIYLKKI